MQQQCKRIKYFVYMVFLDPILRVCESPGRLLSQDSQICKIMSWRPPAASLLLVDTALIGAQDSPILAPSRCHRSAYDAGWEHGPCGICPHGHGSRLGDSVVFPQGHGIWPWGYWLRKEPRFSIPQSPFYAYLILLSSIISWTKISSWDCHRNHQRPYGSITGLQKELQVLGLMVRRPGKLLLISIVSYFFFLQMIILIIVNIIFMFLCFLDLFLWLLICVYKLLLIFGRILNWFGLNSHTHKHSTHDSCGCIATCSRTINL